MPRTPGSQNKLRVAEDARPRLDGWLRMLGLDDSSITDSPAGSAGISVRLWPDEISILADVGTQLGISSGPATRVIRSIVRSAIAYSFRWPDDAEPDISSVEDKEWWEGRVGPAAMLTAQLERLDAETLEEVVGAGLAMLEPAARRRLLGE